MEKIIKIENKEIGLRASALLPKIYRVKFNSDLMSDLRKLQNGFKNNIDNFDTEILNQIIYAMAYNYDNKIIDYDSWLDQFENPFSLFSILNEVLELWVFTNKTTSTPSESSKGDN